MLWRGGQCIALLFLSLKSIPQINDLFSRIKAQILCQVKHYEVHVPQEEVDIVGIQQTELNILDHRTLCLKCLGSQHGTQKCLILALMTVPEFLVFLILRYICNKAAILSINQDGSLSMIEFDMSGPEIQMMLSYSCLTFKRMSRHIIIFDPVNSHIAFLIILQRRHHQKISTSLRLGSWNLHRHWHQDQDFIFSPGSDQVLTLGIAKLDRIGALGIEPLLIDRYPLIHLISQLLIQWLKILLA